MNVIEFDALVAAVLHLEEFAFGSVEISSLERSGPRFGIHGDDDLFAAEDEFHLAPVVGSQIDFFERQKLIQPVNAAFRVSRTAGVLPHRMVRIFRVCIDLQLHAVTQ
jgi:hypothetical protein